MKTFHALYPIRLTIDDLFSLNKSTIEYANLVRKDIGKTPKAILDQLEIDNKAMGMQMNKASKNVLTAQLSEMDDERDDRFSEIKRNVTTALLGRDATKKEAAQNFKIFLNPYWDTNNKAMNTQTGIMDELFEKYTTSELLVTQATTIGITEMIAELKTVNSEFETLYQTRNEQEAAQEGPSATSMKAAAANNYTQFCTAVEQATNFTPSDIFTSLFYQLDELRKTYARLIHKKDKEEEENTSKVE